MAVTRSQTPARRRINGNGVTNGDHGGSPAHKVSKSRSNGGDSAAKKLHSPVSPRAGNASDDEHSIASTVSDEEEEGLEDAGGLGNLTLGADGEKKLSQSIISKLVMVYYFFGWTAAFTVPFSWRNLWVCVALYWVRMFFVTAGYHRYFSHCTYKTSRVFQFFLAFMAETSLQQGVCWWASHHRTHHRECDTPADPHSPVHYGFWKSHCLWIEDKNNYNTHWSKVRDLCRFPELVVLSEFFVVPPLMLGTALYMYGGAPMFVWGFVVSTWALSHGTFLVNSANHLWGSKRYICAYQPGCTARNNWWVTVLTLGEGWHNNHHHRAGVARQGFFWYEIDITYYILRVWQAVGLIWDIREPNYDVLARKAEEFKRFEQQQHAHAH